MRLYPVQNTWTKSSFDLDSTQMFNQFAKSNRSRTIAMPRRTCRMLASGCRTAMMAMMIALLIRTLFWHKKDGEYRIDGRTKLSWIAETFGISTRSITDARATLIELDWITPIECPQWELNKWGQRYRLNVDTFEAKKPNKLGQSKTTDSEQSASKTSSASDATATSPRGHPCPNDQGRRGDNTMDIHAGIASPQGDFQGKTSSPWLNSSSSSSMNLKTRNPAPCGGADTAAEGSREKDVWDRGGVGGQSSTTNRDGEHPSTARTEAERQKTLGKEGVNTTSPKTKPKKTPRNPQNNSKGKGSGGVMLRDIRVEDLRDTDRLLELYRQAIERGLVSGSEAGRLDFFALAERARAQGRHPARMFAWLITRKRFEFITQADEDAAARRLRELHYPPPEVIDSEAARDGSSGNQGNAFQDFLFPTARTNPLRTPKPKAIELTDDERFVVGCLKIAKMHRHDPFRIAQAKGWSQERWELALDSYQRKDRERWQTDGE